MLNTKELQTTVSKLSENDLREFTEWFEEFIAQRWDSQIENDVLAGRLDKIGESVDTAFIKGHVKPL
jgi:hypothetical protein